MTVFLRVFQTIFFNFILLFLEKILIIYMVWLIGLNAWIVRSKNWIGNIYWDKNFIKFFFCLSFIAHLGMHSFMPIFASKLAKTIITVLYATY
jgi:hypothetical protein